MEEFLQKKLIELKEKADGDCWYIVKQKTSFPWSCYLVSFLQDYKEQSSQWDLEAYIEEKAAPYKEMVGNDWCATHRALKIAEYYGLIKAPTGNGRPSYSKYDISPVFTEITARCGGKYEDLDKYYDIMERQLEKIYISSPIDDGSNGIRSKYALYPLMLLYKVLLECEKQFGEAKISFEEYKLFVITANDYSEYIDILFYIKQYRAKKEIVDTQNIFSGKETRLHLAIAQLRTLDVKPNENYIALNKNCTKDVQMKICAFEKNMQKHITDDFKEYIDFLCSAETLFCNDKKTAVSGNIKHNVALVKAYISAEGFNYSHDIIENFYLSLKTKPFVILAGISGTGKTKLVKLFAEAIGAEYKMIPVRPDWSDSTDLFGHTDLSGKNFIPGDMLNFIKAAHEHLSTPYILCLDEMNLARVEHYFSDVLSVIETRKLNDGKITSDSLIGETIFGEDTEAKATYSKRTLPENLYIVGTVNMDETTFQFSKKVLDRANTIEFNEVELIPDGNISRENVSQLAPADDFLKSKYITLKDCQGNELTIDVCERLQVVNTILQKYNAHVGYRVRDEIVFYMLYNAEAGLLKENEAFDNALMQKILPRIQGSNSGVKKMLCELFDYCSNKGDKIAPKSDSNVADEMNTIISTATLTYPKSAKKIASMVAKFEYDGFTTFWI